MKKGFFARIPVLLFVICLVLMLYITRMFWKTIDNKIADVHRQQGHQTNSSHSLALVKTDTILRGVKGTRPTSNIGFLHLVIQFPLLSNASSNDTAFVRERQLEYIQTLQINLAHPLVKRVHILCEDDQAMRFIKHHFKLNAQKIILKNIGHQLLYSDSLAYVSKQLLFETCIIMHADIYIGKGFERLDPNILKQGTIYALTRHEDREQMKACPGLEDFCDTPFRGSHDAFVMHLVRPLPDEVLSKMNYRPNLAGAENVFIYMLETYGHFRFKNPCSILYIIHNQCRTGRDMKHRLVEGQRLESYLKVPGRSAGFSGL
ncbi:uncharacterized protein LOC116303566 isoform X1 [Actinia tenebrosa]|uniref:Uncharacterized protein LOC116303566 isoform X1 n=1 Tax=Actinia tenebrosa TaxID=6105 RepID=A0A6P8IRJ4_ACTTE|nr:uncharacterized protein LOC116303566 isoform X1 [Actinia tenebrosa]XP_031568990.1 uncharacterized protein LOC116303566 isoform X1 [Actinia tenebrosa]